MIIIDTILDEYNDKFQILICRGDIRTNQAIKKVFAELFSKSDRGVQGARSHLPGVPATVRNG
jgi:hypothetical protein